MMTKLKKIMNGKEPHKSTQAENICIKTSNIVVFIRIKKRPP